jgi:ring-1,2-phenylacetyl-CoA epoxidase subunit PaaD
MNESPTYLPDEPDHGPVTCPFCGSDETEPHSLFGSLMLMEQHYCRTCRTVFERIRDDEPPAEPDGSSS